MTIKGSFPRNDMRKEKITSLDTGFQFPELTQACGIPRGDLDSFAACIYSREEFFQEAAYPRQAITEAYNSGFIGSWNACGPVMHPTPGLQALVGNVIETQASAVRSTVEEEMSIPLKDFIEKQAESVHDGWDRSFLAGARSGHPRGPIEKRLFKVLWSRQWPHHRDGQIVVTIAPQVRTSAMRAVTLNLPTQFDNHELRGQALARGHHVDDEHNETLHRA
ncbi:hypothetical protein EDB89DRAFT_1911034 [Lactarius sanguifluus]|nr:hypothetical protein EDB89DRAFT_1911034 [Lactarius sanguifluus]